MFLKAAKPSTSGSHDVEFTAADLNDTIALYRRMSAAENGIARAIDQSIEDKRPGDYGRLPPGAQGPHSPTDYVQPSGSDGTLISVGHLILRGWLSANHALGGHLPGMAPMNVASKPKWLEHYKAAQDQGHQAAQRRTAARNRPWTLVALVASLIAVAVVIYTWA
jgi:hypothetical protein